MRGNRGWPAYAVLSEPLKVLGVERRFFLLSAILGGAIWNAVNSLLAGLLVFGVMYAAGWFAWRYDQHLLNVVRLAIRYKDRYDAGLLRDRAPYVVLLRSGDER
ncbi:MAG: VirB3 family type IV secretion system protein [Acidobacteria bacterium]|nr:VirB3 family type IV secretion system protein [Acidobacteriota bacterium]